MHVSELETILYIQGTKFKQEGKLIENPKARALLKAGINAKKDDPRSDFTPLSYRRIEDYIELLEKAVTKLGGELPKFN